LLLTFSYSFDFQQRHPQLVVSPAAAKAVGSFLLLAADYGEGDAEDYAQDDAEDYAEDDAEDYVSGEESRGE
jgi:hypothetical protein